MVNRILMIATLTVLTFVGLQRPVAAAYAIENEDDFVFYMEKIANGQIDTNSPECKDPSADYDKYCYIEITKSFTLTSPMKIPARVHLLGIPTNGQKPIITASYDVALNKSKPPCVLNLIGDQAVLENITLNAFTYRSTLGGPFNVDNAICMSGNYGFVKNVTINSPGESAPPKFVPIDSNGINVIGSNNTIHNNTITLSESVGLVLSGNNTRATKNTIKTDYYSVLVQNKSPGIIFENTVTGKVAFLFRTNFFVPVGQATNILLFNNFTDTDHVEATSNAEAYGVEYAQFLPLPDCGTCKGVGGEQKVTYADDGTCNKVPASGACIEIKNPISSIQLATENKSPDSELQVNQNTKQPTILPATTPTPGSELEAKNGRLGQPVFSEAGGAGGCSLIR